MSIKNIRGPFSKKFIFNKNRSEDLQITHYKEKMDSKKLAIVTGGASGLGLATCQKFVESGYRVAIFDLNETEGNKQVQALGPNNAAFWKVNVTDEAVVKSAVESVVSKYGNIDVLVNSAGIVKAALTVNRKGEVASSEILKQVLTINVIGTFNVMKYVALAMTKQEPKGEYKQRGCIINVGSAAGFEGQNGQVYYSASKGAIHAMTMPVARDLGRYGIRVVAIAPGIINTPMGQGMSKRVQENLTASTALGRLGEADEFADCVYGIVNSSYMTGNVVRLDGGSRLPKL